MELESVSVSTSLRSASLSLERSRARSLYSSPGVLARLVRNWHSSDVKAAFSKFSFKTLGFDWAAPALFERSIIVKAPNMKILEEIDGSLEKVGVW